MENISGDVLIGQHIETSERTYEGRTTRSWRVLVDYEDGQRIAHPIYWPDNFRPPSLTEGQVYAFPVKVRPKRDGKGLTYTARTDLMPFAPPQAA